jgi:hypothetical protein
VARSALRNGTTIPEATTALSIGVAEGRGLGEVSGGKLGTVADGPDGVTVGEGVLWLNPPLVATKSASATAATTKMAAITPRITVGFASFGGSQFVGSSSARPALA